MIRPDYRVWVDPAFYGRDALFQSCVFVRDEMSYARERDAQFDGIATLASLDL